MSKSDTVKESYSGLAGMVCGALALCLALFLHGAGPLDPQPTIGQSIGEIAADIRQSTIWGLNGEPQPTPQAQQWSLVGIVLKENKRLAFGAVGIGGLAIRFQLFVWTVMFIAGVIIIGFILANLTEILGDIGGG